MKNIVLRTSMAAMLLLGVADAAGFSYEATGGFVPGSGITEDNDAKGIVYPNAMRIGWGSTASGSTKSYFQLQSASGTVEDDGGMAEFGTLVHENYPIISNALKYVQLEWSLHIDGQTSDLDRTWTFDLYNWETHNDASRFHAPNPEGECPRTRVGTVFGPDDHPFLGDGKNETECDDAHNFGEEKSGTFEEDHTWIDGGNIYYIKFSGFYSGNTLTNTYWAAENRTTSGMAKFSITKKGPAGATVGNRVWLDTNKNGIQDRGESKGAPAVMVELHKADGTLVDSDRTNANGYYSFANVQRVVEGSGDEIEYYVQFICPPTEYPHGFTSQRNPGKPLASGNDSDADASGRTGNFTVPAGGTADIDAGIKYDLPPGTDPTPPEPTPPPCCDEPGCVCDDLGDSTSSMGTTAGILMMFMTAIIGLFFVRREEKFNRNER